jgi:ABC-type transporter Mla subunit MlaD
MSENRILEEIREQLTRIERNTEKIMATQADLDTAISNLTAAEAARDAAVSQAFTDLLAKIAAGQVTTPADFTAEVTALQTLQTNAAAITATATADDPGPTVVPTT